MVDGDTYDQSLAGMHAAVRVAYILHIVFHRCWQFMQGTAPDDAVLDALRQRSSRITSRVSDSTASLAAASLQLVSPP